MGLQHQVFWRIKQSADPSVIILFLPPILLLYILKQQSIS